MAQQSVHHYRKNVTNGNLEELVEQITQTTQDERSGECKSIPASQLLKLGYCGYRTFLDGRPLGMLSVCLMVISGTIGHFVSQLNQWRPGVSSRGQGNEMMKSQRNLYSLLKRIKHMRCVSWLIALNLWF